MEADEIKELIALGHELRGLEFKAAGLRSDKAFLAKICRAAIAMANRRDGGHILLGVDDGPPPVLAGLSAAQLATWTFDALSASFGEYCEPNVVFDIETVLVDGHAVVVVAIREFEQVPVICKKTYDRTLREGALYVRSHRMPETVEVPGYPEMRELIDLATDKGVRAFVSTATRAGVTLRRESGASLFDAELGEFG